MRTVVAASLRFTSSGDFGFGVLENEMKISIRITKLLNLLVSFVSKSIRLSCSMIFCWSAMIVLRKEVCCSSLSTSSHFSLYFLRSEFGEFWSNVNVPDETSAANGSCWSGQKVKCLNSHLMNEPTITLSSITALVGVGCCE